MMYHKPVLLQACVEGLAVKPEGIYVDVTYGGGGHAKEILNRLGNGRLIAFDQDEEAMQNKIEDERLILINQNFRYLKNFLRFYNALPVDGILADLGVSSHQFDTPDRGFSIRFEAELDLRMDTRKGVRAWEVLRDYSEESLKAIFTTYGEVPNAARLASEIVRQRNQMEMKTVEQFKEAIASCVDKKKENKYLARVFQALRIEVNDELGALHELLLSSHDVLKPGGRLVVVSYHSLEDRMVKNYMRAGNFEGVVEKDFFGNPQTPFKTVTRKPIVPTDEEIKENPRARSAKLRIAEKK